MSFILSMVVFLIFMLVVIIMGGLIDWLFNLSVKVKVKTSIKAGNYNLSHGKPATRHLERTTDRGGKNSTRISNFR